MTSSSTEAESKQDKYYGRFRKDGEKQGYEDYVSSWYHYCSDTLRSKLLWWLKPLCPASECHMKMTHFHFTCLTCPTRRFRRNPKGKFRRYPKAMLMLESASGRGFILPKRYMTYGLFIPVNVDGQPPIWKRIILKLIMSFAERVTEV